MLALAWFMAAVAGPLLTDKIAKIIALALLATAMLSELFALLAAIFLMARNWRFHI